MRAFKHLAAALALSTAQVASAGTLIFGDSISAYTSGWANLLRNDDPSIQVHAMPGRMIRDFEMPRDLKKGGWADTAVYWLGINDAYVGNPLDVVERAMIGQLHHLMSRGFRTIVLIPPYSYGIGEDSHQLRDMFHDYCDRREDFPKLECYEVEPWDDNMTLDSIHPTDELHQLIADWFKQEIL